MKKNVKNAMLLVMLCIGLGITSCSADEMFGNPELSVELTGGDGDGKDLDWDKSKIDFDNGGSNNP